MRAPKAKIVSNLNSRDLKRTDQADDSQFISLDKRPEVSLSFKVLKKADASDMKVGFYRQKDWKYDYSFSGVCIKH